MTKRIGTNKHFLAAEETQKLQLKVEKFYNKELESALEILKHAKDGVKIAPIQFGAAKSIIEGHAKFVKGHGKKAVQPKDFADLSYGATKKEKKKAGILTLDFEEEKTGT